MIEIRVYKQAKTLELWKNDEKFRSFSIGIGKGALGPKQREGDHITPEGEYKICVRNPKSRFHLSLGLNYPNRKDADCARSAGTITTAQHAKIVDRLNANRGSDWSTPIGGAIYIHGDLETQAWSEGCIRMFNQDIDELFPLAIVGTKVTIFC